LHLAAGMLTTVEYIPVGTPTWVYIVIVGSALLVVIIILGLVSYFMNRGKDDKTRLDTVNESEINKT